MTKDEALKLALEGLESIDWHGAGSCWVLDDIKALRAHNALKEALAQPTIKQPLTVEEERSFCPRCGKRLASGFVEISIHTCTPPGADQ